MTPPPPAQRHWLDDLAVAYTRRQGLKAALAGAALTLPFVRLATARAANPHGFGPHDCQAGCLYSSHREMLADYADCTERGQLGIGKGFAVTVMLNPIFGLFKIYKSTKNGLRCQDRAILEQKARNYDCTLPDCPGFDPQNEWGPCVNCASTPGCLCCPDSGSETGYSYCPGDVGFCCAPDGGCKSC